MARTKKNLRRPVPESHNLASISRIQILAWQHQQPLTSCVYVRIGIPNARARPKSANFRLSLWSISKFCGFRSRWSIRWEWQYRRPELSWWVNFCLHCLGVLASVLLMRKREKRVIERGTRRNALIKVTWHKRHIWRDKDGSDKELNSHAEETHTFACFLLRQRLGWHAVTC